MENPFRYGEVVRGAYFAGRRRERTELASDVRSGQNVLVISPRRFGKTSLVLETLDELRGEGVLHAYVDLLSAPTFDRLPDVLAGAIHRGLIAPVEGLARRAAAFFGDLPLRPRINYDPSGGTFSVEFVGAAPHRDVAQTVERLLAMPGEIARRYDRRVVLVLDEFQAVTDLDIHLPATMRAIFQHQSAVSHVFLGSQRHIMEKLFTDENEPMFRLAKPFRLGPIPDDEFGAFIRKRFASTRSPIHDEAVDRILGLTHGHPHDTQELCYFLWWAAQSAGIFPVPASAVDQALDRVVDAESARFLTVWERLRGKQQRAVLAAIAAEPAIGLYGEDFRRRHRLGAVPGVQKAIDRLLELGVIEPQPGSEAVYRPADTFLPAWLRRIRVIAP